MHLFTLNEGDKNDEQEKTIEKDNDYQDCNDFVLLDNKEESSPHKTDRSLSPDRLDKLLGAARPGTSPIVNRVRKSDYNRISS